MRERGQAARSTQKAPEASTRETRESSDPELSSSGMTVEP